MKRWFIITSTLISYAVFGQSGLEGLAKLKGYSAGRASSVASDWHNSNWDFRDVKPGATVTLADLTGPGEVTHMWVTIAARERSYSRLLTLRMYWDGEKEPSVECPLGDFFGIGHGMDVPFDSLPVRVTSDGRGRNCYWPMPFRKSARIAVTNEGKLPIDAFYWYVDYRKREVADDEAYFHAMYRQEFPTIPGRNYVIADISGRGHYIGTILSVRQLTPSWWGEGDDFFFIDGEAEPSIRGTGSEDYFCDGWGFRKQAGAFYGAPLVEGDAYGDRTTVYRWHVPDPIPFIRSLRMEMEHKGVTFKPDGSFKSGFEERLDDFSSVALWYQTEPHKPYAALPPGPQRLYYDYSKTLEAENWIGSASATEGAIEKQELGGWSGGAQLWWRPSEANQTLTIPFEIKQAGRFEVALSLCYSYDYGTYQIELDGKPLGAPLDLYSPYVTEHDKVFAPMELDSGKHTLTVRGHGKSEKSAGYYFGLDGILLTRRSARNQ